MHLCRVCICVMCSHVLCGHMCHVCTCVMCAHVFCVHMSDVCHYYLLYCKLVKTILLVAKLLLIKYIVGVNGVESMMAFYYFSKLLAPSADTKTKSINLVLKT